MYRMIVPKDSAWNTIVVPSTTLVFARPCARPASMVLIRRGSGSVHASAGSRPSSPSGHAPSPSRRAAGQPPPPWRCARSSSSSLPYVSFSSPASGSLRPLSCNGYIYILEPPDATHGDAVGRYVRANACLYLLLPTRLAIHSCMTLPKSGRQPGAIDTHTNL